jgi:hypothetical protein
VTGDAPARGYRTHGARRETNQQPAPAGARENKGGDNFGAGLL